MHRPAKRGFEDRLLIKSILDLKLKPKKLRTGTIINVSDGRSCFTTNAVLQVDNEIELLIILSVKNIEKDYRIHGTIRFRRTVISKDEITNCGIQCVDADRKILLEIKKFAERQKAGTEHKTVK